MAHLAATLRTGAVKALADEFTEVCLHHESVDQSGPEQIVGCHQSGVEVVDHGLPVELTSGRYGVDKELLPLRQQFADLELGGLAPRRATERFGSRFILFVLLHEHLDAGLVKQTLQKGRVGAKGRELQHSLLRHKDRVCDRGQVVVAFRSRLDEGIHELARRLELDQSITDLRQLGKAHTVTAGPVIQASDLRVLGSSVQHRQYVAQCWSALIAAEVERTRCVVLRNTTC